MKKIILLAVAIVCSSFPAFAQADKVMKGAEAAGHAADLAAGVTP